MLVQDLSKLTSDQTIPTACWTKIINQNTGQYQYLLGDLLVRQRLGSGSAFGDVFSMCAAERNKDASAGCILDHSGKPELMIASKVQMLQSKDVRDLRNLYDLKPQEEFNSVQVEMLSQMLCTELVVAGICPNVPVLYGTLICTSCTSMIQNINVLEELNDPFYFAKRYGESKDQWASLYSRYAKVSLKEALALFPSNYSELLQIFRYGTAAAKKATEEAMLAACVIFLTEYAQGGDLQTYLTFNKKQMTKVSMDSLHIQVLMGLIALQHHFGMVHFDLHLGNVLVHPIPPSKELLVYEYKFPRGSLFVPMVGALYVLTDFGHALFPFSDLEKTPAARFVDSVRFSSSVELKLRDMAAILTDVAKFKIRGVPKVLHNLGFAAQGQIWDTFPTLVDAVFGVYASYTKRPKEPHKIVGEFDMTKKLVPLNSNLGKFVL